MKKVVSFLVCFALSFAAFAQPTDKTLAKIPANTPIMVSFNLSHFLEKVSTDQIKSYEMIQFAYSNMKKGMGKDSSILKKLYAKPKAYGLDVLPSAVMFIRYDTTLSARRMLGSPLVGLSVPLSSSKKFEKLLVQTMKEKYVDFVEKRDGYKFYINNQTGFAWDKKNLVLLAGKKETIEEKITNVMTLPESGSVLSNSSLKKAISHEGDICAGIDLSAFTEVFQKYFKSMNERSEGKDKAFNPFSFYKYGDGDSYATLDFANGGIVLNSESKAVKGQEELMKKLSKEKMNNEFASYLPEGNVYGGISVTSNVSILKEYFDKEGKEVFDSIMVYAKKEGIKKLVRQDSAIVSLKENYWADSTTWQQRREIDKKVKAKSDELYEKNIDKAEAKIDSTLAEYGLDLTNVWGIFKGDFLVAMTGTKEIIDTFKTYDYIENEEGEYEYLEVEKTKLQKIPSFRSFATVTNIPVFQRVLDSLVSKKKLVKGENGTYSIEVPQMNLSFAIQGDVMCFTNDTDFMNSIFSKGKKEAQAVSGEAKELLFNYNTAMSIDVESIMGLIDEDAKKGPMSTFVELANSNFSKITMTSKIKESSSQGVFKLGMKSDRNSFLQLMDLGNELFLKFSGKKF